MSKPIIRCNNLSKIYNEEKKPVKVLSALNMQLNAGELLGIIGVSGVGKTTLLQLLGGLDQPTSGEVIIMGKNLTHMSEKQKGQFRNKNIGFIYQFHHLLPEFNALENIALPLLLAGKTIKAARQKAEAMLEDIDLINRAKHRVGELSGGERQRIAIARALVNNPSCVLADEPTGNLDAKTAHSIFELLCKLNQQYKTSFIVVTHNKDLATKLDRVLNLQDGILHEVVGEQAPEV